MKKDLHHIIDRCQQIIISSMRGASAECVVLFAKDRIDESNMTKVRELARQHLDPDKALKVEKALSFMRQALDELVKEHYEWALDTGKMFGNMYKVTHIDHQSLALEGLYKAIIRFRPTGSFRSYATSWIRQAIQRSYDKHMLYSLDDPINAYDSRSDAHTRIDMVRPESALWPQSTYFAPEPFRLEELRQQYCPHLNETEFHALLANRELAESVGC